MTFREAITTLRKRSEYLGLNIKQRSAEGKGHRQQMLEQESIAIAISAIEYTNQMQEYERNLIREKDSD